MMGKFKICIVGAGSSGMVAAKTLHQRGIAFDCFEKGSGIGGLWRYQNDNGLSAAYRSLHINTSRDQMQFADFPMPDHYPDFPHHSLIAEYFDRYVDHFGFRDKITFRTSVTRIEPQPDGTFSVQTQDANGRRQGGRYSAVVVANGHHWKPHTPEFAGRFDGQVMHSHDYRTPEEFAGKRVLVVGIGNSACDIACELSRVAGATMISVRRGVHVIPKYIFGMPLDQAIGGWAWRYLPQRIFEKLFDVSVRLTRGRVTQYGLPKPKHSILGAHPTISSELLHTIGHGRIHVRPGIDRMDGNQVRFADGRAERFDAIVFATGYDISVPFLDASVFSAHNNEVRLYKHVVHPQRSNLFFIGLIQPWGAMMPLADEQSRWIADLIEGKCGLPSPAAMERDIDRCREKMQRRYAASQRHTVQVDFYPYLDELRRRRGTRGRRISLVATADETSPAAERAA